MATKSILESALNGGRASRNGDLVVVVMPAQAFVTTAQEYSIIQQWGRSKQSNGLPQRDRNALIEKFETLIPRNHSGLAARGNPKVLRRMVADMEQLGMVLEDWAIPPNLEDEGMKPRKKAADGTEVEADDSSEAEGQA